MEALDAVMAPESSESIDPPFGPSHGPLNNPGGGSRSQTGFSGVTLHK